MVIREFEWVNKNQNLLTKDEIKELTDIGVFRLIEEKKLDIPIMDTIMILHRIDFIIAKYQHMAPLNQKPVKISV